MSLKNCLSDTIIASYRGKPEVVNLLAGCHQDQELNGAQNTRFRQVQALNNIISYIMFGGLYRMRLMICLFSVEVVLAIYVPLHSFLYSRGQITSRLQGMSLSRIIGYESQQDYRGIASRGPSSSFLSSTEGSIPDIVCMMARQASHTQLSQN